MPYNIVADGFYTKKFCSKLSSRELQFQTGNIRFAFLNTSGALGERTLFILGSLESS